MSENPKAAWTGPMRIIFAALFIFRPLGHNRRPLGHDRRPGSVARPAVRTW